MTAPLAPGDWVECIRKPSSRRIYASIVLGGIYCVEQVRTFRRPCNSGLVGTHRCDCVGYRLAGIELPPRAIGFTCSTSFRPIYRPKAELVEGLLKVKVLSPREESGEKVQALIAAKGGWFSK